MASRRRGRGQIERNHSREDQRLGAILGWLRASRFGCTTETAGTGVSKD